jgi:hypothetical protein
MTIAFPHRNYRATLGTERLPILIEPTRVETGRGVISIVEQPGAVTCVLRAWFKTPGIRVTVLALLTGVGSCSGFCLPRSGGIS